MELYESLEELESDLFPAEIELYKRDRIEFSRALGFEPEPWQEDLLTTDSNRIILNCSRQVGKSTFASMVALHTAMFEPDSLILVFAPSLRQSQEFFRKVDDHWTAYGLRDAESERKLGLELPNGSRIEALPGTEKTTKGFSAPRLIILDEASRIDDDLYYDGVFPMIATNPEATIMLLSTPYGRRGFFHDVWHEAKGWKRIRITAEESRSISQTYLEEAREMQTNRQFRQNHFCEFLDADDALFNSDDIDRAYGDFEWEPVARGVFG